MNSMLWKEFRDPAAYMRVLNSKSFLLPSETLGSTCPGKVIGKYSLLPWVIWGTLHLLIVPGDL